MDYGSAKKKLAMMWEMNGIITDRNAINSFLAVPREKFILEQYKSEAYSDYPLPIPAGQTISQPTTVMIITQVLELKPGLKVLEVGAGSGYQAAIIANIIGGKGIVYATEIIPELALFAEKNLCSAGIENVEVINWDGSKGYEKEAPYDRILVSAAAPEIPKPLASQLREGGMLVAPVGERFSQQLIRARKIKGKLVRESFGDFVFVPLTGKFGSSLDKPG